MDRKLGKFRVADTTHLPGDVVAGRTFVVVVELDNEVGIKDEPVKVSLEGQRLVPDFGGFPTTRPPGQDYFVKNFGPALITISSGKFGVSTTIIVRKDATAQDGEVPVNFPEKLLISAYVGNLQDGFRSDLIYVSAGKIPEFDARTFALADDLVVGQKVPNKAEKDVVGAATSKIVRNTTEFAALAENKNADIVFKDEEQTGADRMMTTKLKEKVDKLAALVKSEWSGVKLRVTEAWDENNEHGTNSVHYEARAVDVTTSDQDGTKLGRLGRLAVNAGFEWVFYENENHIHASMSK